jgi:hypothetical protein
VAVARLREKAHLENATAPDLSLQIADFEALSKVYRTSHEGSVGLSSKTLP